MPNFTAVFALCSVSKGLRLFNLAHKNLALKVQWVKVYYDNDEIRSLADPIIGRGLRAFVWQININQDDRIFYSVKIFGLML